MSLVLNQFSFNTEMDALLDKLGNSSISVVELQNIQERIDKLYSIYADAEIIGKDKYKLFFTQAVLSFRRASYSDAHQWLELARQTIGSEFPDYANLSRAINEHNNAEQPVQDDAMTLKLLKHTGLLIAWQNQEFQYRGSPEILRPYYMRILYHNIFLGWWSAFSLLINPASIIINWYKWVKYKYQYDKLA
jgi:hypothetical protein